MKQIKPMIFLLAATTGTLVSCGGANSVDSDHSNAISTPAEKDLVIRSRSSFDIRTGDEPQQKSDLHARISSTTAITVTNAPNSRMTLDNSMFVIPNITNDVLSFGVLQIPVLDDNQLKVCGTSGKQKCTTAIIRIYTTGTAGAGLYNSVDGYGIPIRAKTAGTFSDIGLNTSGAVTLQSISIPASKNALKKTDFNNLNFEIQADFTNAGAGSYATTIVVEYALAL